MIVFMNEEGESKKSFLSLQKEFAIHHIERSGFVENFSIHDL